MVVGGGLAGLAAAQALTLAGRQVTVLESRQRLGGRAGSFTDATTGQTIDACQHVSMGCCDQLRKFFTTFGIADFFAPQPELIFRTVDGRKSTFRADRLPAPFHLARAFHRLHYLGLWDRLTIAWGLACLRFTSTKVDPPFLDWLRRHHQTPRAIQLFWGLVLVSALNETVDRIGLRYARKVFVDGFLADRDAFTVQLPTVPLDRLYGTEMRQWFADRGCEIRLNAGVTGFEMAGGRVSAAILRECSTVSGDTFVLAVPFERLPGLAPDEVLNRTQNLKSSP
ncbi:MAG: FAD-dependent oxidoreductase, partial [Gemmataceae bacterium]|nr:FAD-dependent oxidoreductase [Gemmataceae bacterium]